MAVTVFQEINIITVCYVWLLYIAQISDSTLYKLSYGHSPTIYNETRNKAKYINSE